LLKNFKKLLKNFKIILKKFQEVVKKIVDFYGIRISFCYLMYLPEELWGYIHLFLNLDEFCWPCKIEYRIRRFVTFNVRLNSAKPLYKFRNLYKGCVVTDCTASRGAFKDFVVSPYCVQHACMYSCPRILYFTPPF